MHRGHDDDFPGHSNGMTAGIGHNQSLPPQTVQWQRPHLASETDITELATQTEADLDLVEAAFSEGFASASDPTSFLRLAQVPFDAVAADGKRLVLLRVETDAVADVGGITPHLGGTSFRYDPLPAGLVSRRRRLRFIYFDGQTPRTLKLEEVRALRADAGADHCRRPAPTGPS
jgi:hypothetical protein